MNQTQATGSKTAIKGIDIAAYLVRDPQAAIAFYRDVLGMTPTAVDDQGRGAEFTLADGSTFGVWKPEEGGSGGAIMFAVDDAKSAVEHYRARGLEVSDVSESPVCFMAFAQDPEGNAIIIHQRKSSE
ncbi:MAG: VOC family protein [Candidatus Baltobacteraceae bacterium]